MRLASPPARARPLRSPPPAESLAGRRQVAKETEMSQTSISRYKLGRSLLRALRWCGDSRPHGGANGERQRNSHRRVPKQRGGCREYPPGRSKQRDGAQRHEGSLSVATCPLLRGGDRSHFCPVSTNSVFAGDLF